MNLLISSKNDVDDVNNSGKAGTRHFQKRSNAIDLKYQLQTLHPLTWRESKWGVNNLLKIFNNQIRFVNNWVSYETTSKKILDI